MVNHFLKLDSSQFAFKIPCPLSYLLPTIYFWNFCWQKLITVIYIVDIRRPVMISIYIFLKHAKNVVSSVPWNSLHSSGLYFHEIHPNFSKSKISLVYTKKKLYSFLGENTICYVFESKMKEVHNFVFAKKIGTIICFVLICWEIFSKNLPRDVIISHNNPKKTTFFQLFSSRTRQIYLGTLLKVDYAD